MKEKQFTPAAHREPIAGILNVMNSGLGTYQLRWENRFSPLQVIRKNPAPLSVQQRKPTYASDGINQPCRRIDRSAFLQMIYDPSISRPPVTVNPNKSLVDVDKGKEIDRVLEAIE